MHHIKLKYCKSYCKSINLNFKGNLERFNKHLQQFTTFLINIIYRKDVIM